MGLADGHDQFGGRRSGCRPGAGGQPSSVSAGQGGLDDRAQPPLGLRARVPGAHLEPAGQEVGHPAATDHPGTDAGDGPDLVGSRRARSCAAAAATRISRASSGVAAAPRGECTLVVTGASAAQAESEVDVEARVRELLDAGLGPRDVAVAVTGMPAARALPAGALALATRGD